MDNGIDIVLEDEELEVEVQEDFLKGDKGDPGYTPVRGIDYYTEQDKQELIDELTEDIQGVKNDFNTNVVSKTTEFNNNATNKMAEFNANTITKINKYNENAKDLINRVIEAEAENERLRNDLNGLPTGQAEGETIDITDSAEMRFSEFNVRGNSKQETVTDNLFNNTWEQGVIASETGIDTESTTMIRSDYIKIYPNHLYSISRSIYSSYMSYRFYDKDKKYLGNHIAEGMMTYSTSDGRMNENESSMTFTILNTDVEYMRVTDGSNNLSTIYTLTTEAINPDYPSEVESCGDNVNLFDIEASTEFIDCTKNDDEILTQIGKANPVIVNSGLIFKKGKYLMSFLAKKNDGTYSSGFSSVQFLTGNSIALTKLQNPIISEEYQKYIFSFDLETETTFGRILLQLNSNPQSVISIKNIKIEKGTKATPYSSYGQGCINEVICNKNYLKNEAISQSINGIDFIVNEDKSITVSGTATSNAQLFLLGNSSATNLVLTLKANKTYKNVSGIDIVYRKTNGDYGSIVNNKTLIPTEDMLLGAVYIQITSGTTVNDTYYPMLVIDGTDATAYIPHQSQTYTIPTQQPMRSIGDIRDTFVKKNNKWYERHNVGEVIFNGSENWSKDTSTGCYIIQLDEFLGSWSKVQDVSTHWICNNSKAYANTNGYFAISNTGLFWVGSSISTLDEFKTWLLNNNVKVLCRLATPNDIECTSEQSIILDEIENTVKSYKDITHIYSTDNVSPIIDVIYFKEITANGDTLPVGTIVEYEGDTIPDGFEEVEEEGEVYSTEEVRVGTWIDGKPLYRKVVHNTTSFSSSTKYSIQHNIENLDNVISAIGYCKRNGNVIYMLPFSGANDGWDKYSIGIENITTTTVSTFVGSGLNSGKSLEFSIILEYTKITD